MEYIIIYNQTVDYFPNMLTIKCLENKELTVFLIM